ncbi:MAG TPA: HlyD family efflux transporter periplasmic adaptor subunit [Methylomirabilota bacterium]|jgi:HlyD family secretion protein|nr:HlyD family efflux transporter periplasmic adaptor subunit [Methylomirabilota bacterium]
MPPRVLKLAAAAALVVTVGLAVTWASRHYVEPTTIGVTGTIEATQVDISPRITARIVERSVREGQSVARGQLLVRLDDEQLTAELRRAEAALRTAGAQLRDLQAGARAQEIQEAEATAARAQAQLADLQAGSRAEEIAQARAALENATATRVWTVRDYDRTRELFGRELVSAQEVDRMRQASEVAVANEKSAREKLALVEAGARAHEIEAARQALRAARERVQLLRAGPRPEAVAALESQVVEARAAVAMATARLAETRLFSPIDGVVLHKNMEVGETGSPGAAILTLVDPGDVWLRAYVPETDVGRLKVGQPATIKVDAFAGRVFEGAISEVASQAEFTPKNVQTKKERVNLVFRIKIAAKNPAGLLKPGMPADAEIAP